MEGAEQSRRLAPSQSNGTELVEKPHTLEEYAVDHFRLVILSSGHITNNAVAN